MNLGVPILKHFRVYTCRKATPQLSLLPLSPTGNIGGREVRRCCVNFQYHGVLLIWIIVGQGLTALAVGAGLGLFGLFSLVYHSSILSPSLLGDGPIETEILSQRAVKPKTTNEPTGNIWPPPSIRVGYTEFFFKR